MYINFCALFDWKFETNTHRDTRSGCMLKSFVGDTFVIFTTATTAIIIGNNVENLIVKKLIKIKFIFMMVMKDESYIRNIVQNQ